MKIDEAIVHERDIAAIQRNNDKLNKTLGANSPYYKTDCLECAEEHEQLAEWLEELKELRDFKEKSKTNTRNKAIDECLAVLYRNADKIISIPFYEQIFDEMKQLKDGGEND